MFKNFHGYPMLEAYHHWKHNHRKTRNPIGAKSIKVAIAVAVTLLLWFLPAETYGLNGVNAIEQRVIAVFGFAALMWLFDAVPAWTTSLVVVVLLLFCCSSSALWFMQTDASGAKFDNLVDYKAILH
ncbi:MAG: anion permease, partial [Muribaculaceae bacterium]|nr:anion permease [Muribaculaceae bacterium]